MHCLRRFTRKNNYEKLIEDNANYAFYKTFLIQESRYFNSSSINPKKCIKILINILYLLNQGEEMSAEECAETFFATTKLFQSEHTFVRRLMYLCIKELSPSVPDAFMVISSVIKDMSGNDDLYRAAAIRVLHYIAANLNGDIVLTIERNMKQAILDENPAVKSAALVSTFHLTKTAPELARRWINEAQGVIVSDSAMVSYHAFAVVAALRKKSHISIVRLIAKYAHSSLQSPLALSLLIRHAAKLIKENPSETIEHYCLQLIRNSLRHKSDIVLYEAAYAIICLKKNHRDLCQAITVLRLKFCDSPQATYRLAGVRALSKIPTNHQLTTVATTLEHLISDKNKYVAVNAFIMIVNKLFSTIKDQQTIDHVLKIAAKMTDSFLEISDELKTTIVNAVRICYLKYPEKSSYAVSYFGFSLKGPGGLLYKTALVDAITDFVEKYSDVIELALGYLSEYIEDCEYPPLSIRILQVLGNQGPKVSNPCQYIRCIYNRIILNSSPVRAAAVRALARFGAARPELLADVTALLSHCQQDDNNEVRDRAIFYTAILNSANSELIERYIIGVYNVNIKSIWENLINPDVPIVMDTILKQETVTEPAMDIKDKKATTSLEDQYGHLLKMDPEISKLGLPFRICEPIDLTDPDVEYRVVCVKYIFAEHLILQFECLNTLSDQLLEQVHIRLESLADFEIVTSAACDHLAYDTLEYVFCILKFPINVKDTLRTINVILEFVVQDYDMNTKALEPGLHVETYPVEDIKVSCMDQFRIYEADDYWEASWDEAAQGCDLCDTFVVGPRSIDDAIKEVCIYLGLPETVVEIDGNKEVRATCLWRSGVSVLLRARFIAFKLDEIVTMQVAVRSTGKEIAALILSSVGRSICLAK